MSVGLVNTRCCSDNRKLFGETTRESDVLIMNEEICDFCMKFAIILIEFGYLTLNLERLYKCATLSKYPF